MWNETVVVLEGGTKIFVGKTAGGQAHSFEMVDTSRPTYLLLTTWDRKATVEIPHRIVTEIIAVTHYNQG